MSLYQVGKGQSISTTISGIRSNGQTLAATKENLVLTVASLEKTSYAELFLSNGLTIRISQGPSRELDLLLLEY